MSNIDEKIAETRTNMAEGFAEARASTKEQYDRLMAVAERQERNIERQERSIDRLVGIVEMLVQRQPKS
jgi:hypothetical protein